MDFILNTVKGILISDAAFVGWLAVRESVFSLHHRLKERLKK